MSRSRETTDRRQHREHRRENQYSRFHLARYCRPRIADSSSINAVNFSSPRPTKRFPLSRCASTIQIVRPSESMAETEPKLQPRFLRVSARISQYFIRFQVAAESPLQVVKTPSAFPLSTR